MFESSSDRLQIVLNKEQEFSETHGTACLIQPAVICTVLRGNGSLPPSGATQLMGKVLSLIWCHIHRLEMSLTSYWLLFQAGTCASVCRKCWEDRWTNGIYVLSVGVSIRSSSCSRLWSGFQSVTTSTLHREYCIMIMFDMDRSIFSLHRADRARQEVKQRNGIEHKVNFQNKTRCT